MKCDAITHSGNKRKATIIEVGVEIRGVGGITFEKEGRQNRGSS